MEGILPAIRLPLSNAGAFAGSSCSVGRAGNHVVGPLRCGEAAMAQVGKPWNRAEKAETRATMHEGRGGVSAGVEVARAEERG